MVVRAALSLRVALPLRVAMSLKTTLLSHGAALTSQVAMS